MRRSLLAGVLLAGTVLSPTVAQAQDAAAPTDAQIIAEMRAELAALRARVDELEGRTRAAESSIAVQAEGQQEIRTAIAEVEAAPATTTAFKGAPQISSDSGWTFKPRGRVMVDAGTISAPEGIDDGFGSKLRRVRLGVQGDMPGGFGYKVEADFAGNEVDLTDAFLSYEDGGFEVRAGQFNNFQSLEELTSSLNTSFIERAAFTDAFGFRRKVGVGGQWSGGDVLVQAGAFADNSETLPDGSRSYDARIVFMPKTSFGQLHLGASVHQTDLDDGETVRYRQRPLVNFTSVRPVNTGSLDATGEFGYGAEAALISGPFHFAGEAFWQQPELVAAASDPTFFGGYVEAGVFLTPGDSRGYKGGTFDRIKPSSPVGEGGFGAVQFNLRYDRLDLSADGIAGGTQDGYYASLIWSPTAYTRLMLNYGHLEYGDAAVPAANGDRDYAIDVVGARAQVDF